MSNVIPFPDANMMLFTMRECLKGKVGSRMTYGEVTFTRIRKCHYYTCCVEWRGWKVWANADSTSAELMDIFNLEVAS